MRLTYKEAAEHLKTALENWDAITMTSEPNSFVYQTDHCHSELEMAEWIVDTLSKKEGYFELNRTE